MRIPRALFLGLALAALGAPALVDAQAATTCNFNPGPATLAFGAYDASATAPVNSTSTFQFKCTGPGGNSVLATVTLSAGNGGSFNPRQMSNGSDRLSYNLYLDAAHGAIWGDGTGPSQTLNNAVRNTTYTIYGSIPTGQWVTPGSYTDAITITLNY